MAALVLLRQSECHVEQVDRQFVRVFVAERESIFAKLLDQVLNSDSDKDR